MKIFGTLYNTPYIYDIVNSYKNTKYTIISIGSGIYDAIQYISTTRVNKAAIIFPLEYYDLHPLIAKGISVDIYLYDKDPLMAHFKQYGITYVIKKHVLL